MRFKLDGNLRNRGVEFLSRAGHQVSTVYELHLNGASDPTVTAA